MKVEYLKASGFEAAFRGLRNPLDSWNKSDSNFGYSDSNFPCDDDGFLTVVDCWVNELTKDKTEKEKENIIGNLTDRVSDWLFTEGFYKQDYTNYRPKVYIGPNDMKLAQRLIKAGPEHCKFLRQINISFDLTLPFYVWKEFDTYKIGTTANSCSTMHTIHKKEFTLDDFETEFMLSTSGDTFETLDWLEKTIDLLNYYRQKYLDTKDKIYWYQLIKILPESYLQKRTITMNYSVLRNIIKQRKNHKLLEWHNFIDAMKDLPYAEELIFYGLNDKEE